MQVFGFYWKCRSWGGISDAVTYLRKQYYSLYMFDIKCEHIEAFFYSPYLGA